jgi:hypothetical protein
MKKPKLLLMLVFTIIIPLNYINAQKSQQVIIQGPDLIVPFSNSKIDSIILMKLDQEELMKIKQLNCSNKDYKIISFALISKISEDLCSFKSSDNTLSPEMKKAINSNKSGAMFWIEKISCKGSDGKILKLPSISITIK